MARWPWTDNGVANLLLPLTCCCVRRACSSVTRRKVPEFAFGRLGVTTAHASWLAQLEGRVLIGAGGSVGALIGQSACRVLACACEQQTIARALGLAAACKADTTKSSNFKWEFSRKDPYLIVFEKFLCNRHREARLSLLPLSFSSVALSLHSGQIVGNVRSTRLFFRRKPMHESVVEIISVISLQNLSSEIFKENKKTERGTTFNIKSVFPPRLLHLYRFF